MKNIRTVWGTLSIVAMVCSTAAVASDPQVIFDVKISPSPECRLIFSSTDQITARKLDEQRLEVSWRTQKGLVRAELRASCTTQPFAEALSESGFVNINNRWELTAGSGRSQAEKISTPSWHGVAGTYFQGSVCRSVVGESSLENFSFSLDFCVADAEYKSLSIEFNKIEQRISTR